MQNPASAILLLASLSVVCPAQQFKNPQNLGPDMPTPLSVVDEMLKASKIKPGETLYDLGCGDGRILIAAAQKYNAKAVGIELSRDIYEKTSERIRNMGLESSIKVIHGNALHMDLTAADVVTFYFLTSSNDRLKPVLAQLHPGARIVSHDYEVPGWKAADVRKVKVGGTVHTVYVYEVQAAS